MALFARKPVAKPLRLTAEEASDVQTIAALLQDAALRTGDMAYDRSGKHFTVRMNRFCHEDATAVPLRAPSVLRLSCVTRVQMRGLDLAKSQQALALLDIEVEALEAPAHALTLRFAGPQHPDVRVEAECIDVLLMDLAAPRRARVAPNHD